MFVYLEDAQFYELALGLARAQLAVPSRIDAMLEGLNPEYVMHIPTDSRPDVRLVLTLRHLNATERLTDGAVPLLHFLRQAELFAATLPEVNGIRRALGAVSRKAAGAVDPDPSSIRTGAPERIVQRSDLLPLAFFARGLECARSVARLTVVRYDNGTLAAGEGGPKRYLGTGWLIAPDLLVTNHHVVNARTSVEADAGEADLARQVAEVEIQFDFDADDEAGTVERGARLEAFSPASGPLDYAILRLPRPLGRPPLPIARELLQIAGPEVEFQAVNIIQHPEGRSKMVACRNNLVTRAGETDLWYFTDTMSGSSGSPVLDDRWRVVALHKKWAFVEDVRFQGKETAWANVGTQVAAILQDLERAGKAALLDEIRAQPT